MKRIAAPLLLGVVLMSIQTTLVMFLPIQRVRPDLVLMLILYLGLSYPPISGGILAFALGYFTDLFSGNVLGLYTLTRPLLFYGVQVYRSRFYLEGFVFQSLLACISVLLEGLFVFFLMVCLNPSPFPGLHPPFFTVLLPQSLFTGLLAPAVFALFDRGLDFVSGKREAGLKQR